MKKQKILILSVAAIAGLILTGCNLTPDSPKEDVPETSVIDDAIETSDAVGTKVALQAVTPTAQAKISDAFGYQLVEKNDSTMTIRLIAVVDDYKNLTAASVTSTVVSPRDAKGDATIGEDETVVKAEQTFPVDSVYSSLANADDVTWCGTVSEADFAKKYYIIYTLKNIPVAHYYDTIIVKFSATSLSEASQTFIVNANGIAGWDSDITVKLNSGTEYQVTGVTYEANDDVAIPAYHYSVTDGYAVKDGTITSLKNCFDSSVAINKLTLPDTITGLGSYALCINAAEVNIPAKVTTIDQYCFGFKNATSTTPKKIGKLIYGAESLANTNDLGCYATEIVVKAGVKSLPNKFFASANVPTSINFEGTEAEWRALQTTSNASSGFFKLAAWCSDSGYADVTFHLNGGAIDGSSADITKEVRTHYLLDNPGSPILKDKEFKGWYLDAEGDSAFDFASAEVTGDLDLYAVYAEASAGYSLDKPLEVTGVSNSISATLAPGKPVEYLKFTAPSDANADGDWYYFSLDSYEKDETNSTASSATKKITVLDDTKTEVTPDNGFFVYNKGLVQYKCSSSSSNVSKDLVRVFAKPGDTYYLQATLTSDDDVANGDYFYGDIAISHYTYENDAKGEALTLNKGGDAVSPNFTSYNQLICCKYEATDTETVVLKKTVTGSVAIYFYVYDETDGALYKFGDKDYAYPSSSSNGSGSWEFSFDAKAGHTYYIQLRTDYYLSGYSCSLSLSSAPEGYSTGNAIAYSIGETVTAKNANSAVSSYVGGAYYSFSTTADSSYLISTSKGSSSYKQKIVIYDSEGNEKKTISSSSRGSAIEGYEVTLSAGSYTMLVAYDGSKISYYGDDKEITSASWTDFTFTMKEIQEGDSASKPLAITPSTDGTATSLTSTTTGRFYKVTATADNYMVIDLSNLPDGVSASLLTASGSTISNCTYGKRIIYKTTNGTSYILKLSGADSSAASVTFTREDNPETGEASSSAVTAAFGSDGLFDLTGYIASNSTSTKWFKFTASKSATYKLYFQAVTEKTWNCADTSLVLYSAVSATDDDLVTASVKNDDDKKAHPETLNYDFNGYYEYALEAGVTYYAKVSLPSGYYLNNGSYTSVKLGMAEIAVGSQANAGKDAGTIDASATSVTLTGTADGYWNKVTLGKVAKIQFTLPDDKTTAKIYKSSDASNPVATLSGTAASDAVSLLPGDYCIWVQVTDATEETSVDVALSQAALTGYIQETSGTYAWTETSTGSGVWKSGNSGKGSSSSVLTFAFAEDGTFSFSCFGSGEYTTYYNYAYDYLSVKHNDDEIIDKYSDFNNHAGLSSDSDFSAAYGTKSIEVKAGDVITFTFSKDSSGNSGLDAAYVKDIVFTAKEVA